jgi:hypothetical protein
MSAEASTEKSAEEGAQNVNFNLRSRYAKSASSGMGSGNKTVRSENRSLEARATALAKRFRFAIVFAFIIIALYFADEAEGMKAFNISLSNMKEMLSLIPPVFVFMGLLDTWVPKETFIRYMGEASGPLYIAFPIAVLLIKKKAKLAYVFFFLGVWSTMKIPLLLYELSYMGARFTAIQIAVCIPLFLLFSMVIEKTLSAEDRESLYRKAESEFS